MVSSLIRNYFVVYCVVYCSFEVGVRVCHCIPTWVLNNKRNFHLHFLYKLAVIQRVALLWSLAVEIKISSFFDEGQHVTSRINDSLQTTIRQQRIGRRGIIVEGTPRKRKHVHLRLET